MQYSPVVIIGAPRSGTNLLRDVLTSLPGLATWPCDEINYIWRHGNVRYPSDELTPEMARPEICGYIRKQFDRVAEKYQARTVVEKTCANSLRVEFVDHVVPEAKYIFIHRDGLDAIGSAMKRWKADLDISYLARKARFVPASDLPYYASSFLWNRIHRLMSRDKRLAVWGPKLDNMQELLEEHPLDEICAMQWKRCVDQAALAFEQMEPGRWIKVAYEDFVREPEAELGRIAQFLDLPVDSAALKRAVPGVRADNIGKDRSAMSDEALSRIMPLIQDTMAKHGYLTTEDTEI
jgi:hypothetical protein